jgi:hypothetical protein
MKQVKTFIAIAIFSLMSFANATAGKTTDSIPALPVELHYMGNIKNQPVFQLNFSGSREENEFNITITDESGYEFYNANVKGEKFTRQFLFDTEDLGDAKVQFSITGKRSGKTVVYKVDRQTRVLEQMNVVKQ